MASNSPEDAGHSVIPEQDVAHQDETVDSTSEIDLELSLPVRADNVEEETVVDLTLKVNLKPISAVLADQIAEDTVVSTSEVSLQMGSAVLADHDNEETAISTFKIISEMTLPVPADLVDEDTVASPSETSLELSSPVSVENSEEDTVGSTFKANAELILPVLADHIDEESDSTFSDTDVTTMGDKRPSSGDSSETEHSNDEIFDNKNEEHQLAKSTHPGHPWESDSEEEDSDGECDDGQHGLDKNGEAMSFEQTHVTYKTAFGTIALLKDPTKVLGENAALSVDEEPPASVTAPLEPIPQPESFQNEFYEVKRSDVAGFGAFALSKLVKGQTILIEKSLFHADNYSLRDEINKLAPDLRRAFERMPSHGVKSYAGRHEKRAAIFKTNSFVVNRWDCGVFVTASKFNNACGSKKNVAYVYDDRHDCMVFTVEKDIEAGEELFITYGKDPKTLYKQYGFVCRCGGCASLTEAQVEKIKNPGW
ncbi:hypothetical protein LQW54_002133 [Pestalotiopsis sp. IQ-011]